MKMAIQSEAGLENSLINQLESEGYERIIINDESDLEYNFKKQLEKFNKTKFSDSEFKKILIYLEGGSIFEKAKKLRDQFELQRDDNEVFYVKFLNKKEWCKNLFQITNQITVNGKYENRYDVTILINGLPLVQIELKKNGVELKQAFRQIQRYQLHSYHNLFNYIQIFVISNGINTKYFANNSKLNYNFTFFWKDKKNRNITTLTEFASTFLEKCQLSKMIAQYMVLNETSKSLMVLRAYQYYAVEAILERVSAHGVHGRRNSLEQSAQRYPGRTGGSCSQPVFQSDRSADPCGRLRLCQRRRSARRSQGRLSGRISDAPAGRRLR